jgi:uncharacterized protein YdbL (DUF1318 family)
MLRDREVNGMTLRNLLTGTLTGLLLTACVTINVYFPEAAAREAATEFIGDVLGDQAMLPADGDGTTALDGAARRASALAALNPLLWLVPAAHAQTPDININTPAIRAIEARMRQRQQSQLEPWFRAGAIGFGNDGLVKVRDRGAVGLAERSALQQAVNEENKDRNAVYREIAVANGHPEWEDDIRKTFAQRWVDLAPRGWWYQDARGSWRQK